MIVRISVAALVLILFGCSRPESTIAPVLPVATTQYATPSQRGPRTTPGVVILPTPQIARVEGRAQNDAGLQLNILGSQSQPMSGHLQSGKKYVVVKVSIRNLETTPRDVAGFPQSIWLQRAYGSETFDAELYTPGEDNMWNIIEHLSKSNMKHLSPTQSISGSLYFVVPFAEHQFDLAWQPVAQRQWLFGPLTVQ